MEQKEAPCALCNEEIEGREEIKMAGKLFHPKCMKCHHCEKSLMGTPVQMHDGKLYDEQCFFTNFARSCDICKKAIVGANVRFLTSGDKNFHPACYVCFQCRHSLSGREYFMVAGNRLCRECIVPGMGPEL